jgi:hypothetical protein
LRCVYVGHFNQLNSDIIHIYIVGARSCYGWTIWMYLSGQVLAFWDHASLSVVESTVQR